MEYVKPTEEELVVMLLTSWNESAHNSLRCVLNEIKIFRNEHIDMTLDNMIDLLSLQVELRKEILEEVGND